MADNPFLAALERLATGFQGAPAGMSGRLWDELRPWLRDFAVNAAPKWVPRLAFGFPCAVPIYQGGQPKGPCPGAAGGVCAACGRAMCVNHAVLDRFGDGLCYLCFAESVERARGAGTAPPNGGPSQHTGSNGQRPGRAPSSDDLAWARRMLNVTADATLEEIRGAHRKESAKWHPDRHKGPKAKEKAEQKFKDVQRAFDLLKRQHEHKAAA